MNQFRQSLEDLFKEAEMKEKMKDVLDYIKSDEAMARRKAYPEEQPMKPDMASELAGDGTKGFLTIEPERMSMLNGMTLGALRKRDPFENAGMVSMNEIENKQWPETRQVRPWHRQSTNGYSSEPILSVNNGENAKNRVLSLEERYKDTISIAEPMIEKFEGKVDHIYLDTKGNMTSGIGYNVDNRNIFFSIPWKNGERLATPEEKEEVYNIFTNLKKQGVYGKDLKADSYQEYSPLTMDEDVSQEAFKQHVKNVIRYLDRKYEWFRSLPPEKQAAAVDIQFNTGKLTESEFPKFMEAARRGDYAEMARQSHRKGIPENRNRQIYNLLNGE